MQCANCGHINRSDARFCAGCGKALGGSATTLPAPQPVRGATAKVCPRCHAPNALGALTCKRCSYQFISSLSIGGRGRWRWLGWIAVVFVLFLIFARPWSSPTTNSVGPTPIAVLNHTDALERALAATVQVLAPMDGTSGDFSAGSGTVLTENGYILTNFHVIGDSTTQQIYNAKGLFLIAVSPVGSTKPPDVLYQAKLVEADYTLDLALLQITANKDGRTLPKTLPLTVMPIGDSGTIHIGDELTILGFPGIGGSTVTLTRGTVAGFLADWLKTDAEINYGNSGGAAINTAGELVGVPTAGSSDESRGDGTRLPGKLGLVRPINLARHLIERAQKNG